jgi:uracil DNA glycosylase
LWFGNKHFSQTNTYLESLGKTPIQWWLVYGKIVIAVVV